MQIIFETLTTLVWIIFHVKFPYFIYTLTEKILQLKPEREFRELYYCSLRGLAKKSILAYNDAKKKENWRATKLFQRHMS